MVLKLVLAQEPILWVFENSILYFYANLWLTKLKPFSRKVRQKIKNWLYQNLITKSFLENGFEAIFTSKKNFLSFGKGHLSVFCKFLSDELESVFWESKAEPSRPSNSKLVIGSFLENNFEGILRLKTIFLSILKGKYSTFWQFLSDEVETIFWKSESKYQKLIGSKSIHKNLPRKWFWSFFELKNHHCGRLKITFFISLQIFDCRSWIHCLGKWTKVKETIKIKIWL